MKRKPTKILKTSKAYPVYELAHAAWRARAVTDFRYGARGPDDSTVVWTIDAVEYDKGDLAGVRAHVERALAASCIASASFGAAWMGYRELVVTFTDGVQIVERMTSANVVEVREVAA